MTDLPELPGLDPVLDVVAEVAESFVAAGYSLYLVGGVVRDLLLSSFAAVDDIDMTTDARPDEIKRLVEPFAGALWSQGERFGTIGATVNQRHVEITTHRAEAYDEASRKPVVTFGTSIFEDLSRRDFTINAMAISLPDRAVLDPHGGLADLEANVLRTPLSPELSFTDDPLRMLRAARFLPRFGLEAEERLVEAATELAPRLQIVSVERVHDELERLLALDEPLLGLTFLQRTGLLQQAIPPFGLLDDKRMSDAVALASAPSSKQARRAGLFRPLGAEAMSGLRHLRYSGEDTKQTARLIEASDVALEPNVSDESVRKVIDNIGLDMIGDLSELVDAVARRSGQVGAERQPFFERFAQLSVTEDLSDLDSPLTGGEIIAQLGLEPGPIVGRAMTFLRRRRLSVGPMTQREGRDALAVWLREEGR